jgi:hypothetical protein
VFIKSGSGDSRLGDMRNNLEPGLDSRTGESLEPLFMIGICSPPLGLKEVPPGPENPETPPVPMDPDPMLPDPVPIGKEIPGPLLPA